MGLLTIPFYYLFSTHISIVQFTAYYSNANLNRLEKPLLSQVTWTDMVHTTVRLLGLFTQLIAVKWLFRCSFWLIMRPILFCVQSAPLPNAVPFSLALQWLHLLHSMPLLVMFIILWSLLRRCPCCSMVTNSIAARHPTSC